MVKVKIDGVECEIDSSTVISLSYDCGDMVDLESAREGSKISLKLPLGGVNSSIWGVAGDVHPQTKFNSKGYSLVLEVDGIELMSGTAYLMQIVWEQQSRYAMVECRTLEALWASQAAQTSFNDIAIEYSSTLNETNIKGSWEDDSAVKFFPIVRDSYEAEGSDYDITGVRMLRSIDDYHPFFKISALLDAIFGASGFTLSSDTAEAESFDELYISGNYSSAENEAAREAMGFYAKRSEATSTMTDTLGRVSMSPYDIYSTVGNIVDLETIESDSECYNRGGVLQIDDEAVIFKPLTQISAGFEYFLHYTCECEIASRTRLKGIDTLNLVGDGYVKWEITNRYTDYRLTPTGLFSYTLVIFDFEQGEQYLLYGVYANGSKELIAEIDSRFTSVTLPNAFESLRLDIVEDNIATEYQEDWALYNGYVDQSSTTEVEITVRSSPQSYSPTSPMQFEFLLLEGAAAGVEFTLHEDSSVKPYFAEYPGYNSDITFSDLAMQSYTALDILGALQHLFNLRFVTNYAAREVVVESFDRFYSGEEFDWSDKVIEGEDIEFSDWAHTKYRSNKLGYQQTDGVVQRMGESDNKYFGEWSFDVDSYAAAASSMTSLNPIFSASTNDDDGVMVVGDRDDISTVDSLSFSTRIARLFGMIDVAGENYQLPYVCFHDSDEDFTLCFEDRDGVEGLNRLYQSEVALYSRAQIISLSLSITAFDYSNLFAPSEGSPSLRSTFRLTLHGESFKVILYNIESYNPVSGVVRCSFLTID